MKNLTLINSNPENYKPSIIEPFSEEEIAKRARKAGLQNSPFTADTDLDVNEKEITAFFRNLVDEERAKLNNSLSEIRRQKDALINKASTNGDINNVVQKENEIEPKVTSVEAINQEKLKKLSNEAGDALRRFRYFQSEHGLEAIEPKKESAIKHWSILTGLILVEWLALSFFYGQTSNYGLAGGFMTAGIVGLPIAVFSWMLGNSIKKFASKSTVEKYTNILIGLFLGSFIITSILFSGHLRYAASLITQQSVLGNSVELAGLGQSAKQTILASPEIDETFLASQLAWENILIHGAFVADVLSWLLMFASAAFSLLLIKKTYSYLGSENHYWNLYDAWKNKEQELDGAKVAYVQEVDSVYSSHASDIKSITDKAEVRMTQLQKMWDEYYAQLDKFEHYVAEVEAACNRSLSKYRKVNRSIATDPAPKYFESAFSIPEVKKVKDIHSAEYTQTGIDLIKPKIASLATFAKKVIDQIEKKREMKIEEISTSIYTQLKAA